MPASPAGEISLESKVAFLRQPSSFPEAAYRVEAIETHMSWVFLTDGYAYKLKKPVRQDLFDFQTADARRHYCEEEVRLNRRLAPSVYLGTVPMSIDANGHMQLGARGHIIDWLVKMRRLPTRHMLDYLIRHGLASKEMIHRVAERLAGFYRSCVPLAIDPAAYRAGFLREIDRIEAALGRSDYGLSVDRVRSLCRSQRSVIVKMPKLFDVRVRQGKLVEGHGDLRPEHICVADGIDIIDCLEFSRDLRTVDPVDEIGFLALECERLGAPEAGSLLMEYYAGTSGDRPDPALIHFYQGYRASLRAVFAIRHLDEEKFRYSPEWRRRAGEYLDLAERHQDSVSSVMEPPT